MKNPLLRTRMQDDSENRGDRVMKSAMALAVLLVFGLAYLDLLREQRLALEDFTSEQTSLAHAYASALQAQLMEVTRDMETADRLDDKMAVTKFFQALVSPKGLYRQAEVTDSYGIVRVPEGAAPLPIGHNPTEGLTVTSPISDPNHNERLQLFVRRNLKANRTIALLVDSNEFFERMQRTRSTADSSTQVLVSDPNGDWVSFAPSGRLAAHHSLTPDPEIAVLLQEMRSQRAGTQVIGREAAESLDLGARRGVAAYFPVDVSVGKAWSVAVVASAMRVRDRARISAWRLGAATGLAGLLVALFGTIIQRQQRRSLALAEALRLAETTAGLRERSQKIVDVIPVGVLALDRDSRVTSVNPFLAQRQVRSGGTLATAFSHAGADELAIIGALIAEARDDRKPAQRLGLRARLGTSELRDLDAYAIPLERPLQDTDCFLVLHDRTEVRVLERNLVRAEKLATIGTLAAGIAHEVGTPLGIISGRAEQLLGRLPSGEESSRKGLSSILRQVEKVSATIRQLLDFARVRPVAATAVSPAQAFKTASSLLEHRFRQSKVELAIDARMTISPVFADPGQLEQVLVNLLLNAADACGSGGRVQARASERDKTVCFEISDNGYGISPEHLPLVLDPFFTTKKRGQGTGLGLSIAADIVKNHGGTLELESIVGEGTTVRVHLPKAKESLATESNQTGGAFA